MGRGNRSWTPCLATVLLILGAMEDGWAQPRWSTRATIQGWVVDVGGAAVGGVRVRLYRGAYEDTFYAYTPVSAGETLATADGSFSFRVPPGEYTLQLVAPRDEVAPWVAEPVSLELAPGQAADPKIVVRSGGIWEIAITEAGSDRPLAQAHVSIRELASISNVMSATSGADGVARIRLLPGGYEIESVLCDGYAYDGQRRTVAIEEGDTQRVVLTLMPNVRGIVRDPEGQPVAGARVRIVGAGRQEVTSDEQGRFEIVWDRQFQFRDALVFCLVAQYEPRNLATTMAIGRDATALDVKLQACPALVGRLTDPSGQGLTRAWAYVTLRVPNWGDTPLSEEVTAAGADGRFEIRAVPATGQCTLHVCADAYGSQDTTVPVKTADGLSFDVGTLTLPPANLSVSGRVLDTRGNPVAGAMIYGWGKGQPVKLNAETDTLGRFTLDHVCAGKVNLRVDANLGGGRHLRVQVLADAGASGVEIASRDPFSQWSRE
jgi:hypothetical protein